MGKMNFVVKTLAVCAGVVGLAQADPIHTTTEWQSLGRETINDDISGMPSTNSNNGVFWRLNTTDEWTQAVSGTEFDLNQTVQFKVEIWKEFQGTHLSDVAKVWMDGSEIAKGDFALATNGNTKTGLQSVLVPATTVVVPAVTKWVPAKTVAAKYEWKWINNNWQYVQVAAAYTIAGYEKIVTPATTKTIAAHYETQTSAPLSYYQGNVFDGSTSKGKPELLDSMIFSYTFSAERDNYTLIARTMCSDDLANLVTTTADGNKVKSISYVDYDGWVKTKDAKIASTLDWAAFTSTDPTKTFQGEFEKYTFSAKSRNVPEPTLISLLGCGLLGLLFVRRKK